LIVILLERSYYPRILLLSLSILMHNS